MARELDRRAARATLRKLVDEQGRFGLVNLLPAPHDPARFNQWGDDLNSFLTVSHNIDGTLKVTGSLPAGGTAGQVLVKQSGVSGDAAWATPASLSDDTPLAATSVGDPGVSIEAARSDHSHPAGGASGAAMMDAIPVVTRKIPVTGDIYACGSYSPGAISMFGRGEAHTFRIGASGTYKLGTRIGGAGGAGAVIRFGVFNDDNDGMRAGTLVTDCGTIDGTVVGQAFAPGAVALEAGTRYWVIQCEQGGAAVHPSVFQVQNPPYTPYWQLYSNLPATQVSYAIGGAYADNPGGIGINSNPPLLVLFQAQ